MNRFRFVAAFSMAAVCLTGCAGRKPVVASTPTVKQPAPVQPAPLQPQLRLPFDTGPASASDPYPTMVDYAWTPAQLCALSGCATIQPSVLAAITVIEHCTAARCGSGSGQVSFRLVKPASRVLGAHLKGQHGEDLGVVSIVEHGSLEDAAATIDSMGLRPATARELITFAKQHKEVFAPGSEVVALGTSTSDNDGVPRYAAAYRDDNGDVRVIAISVGPGSRTTFLAAPK